MPLPIVAGLGAIIIQALMWFFRSQIGRILMLGLAWFGVNYVTLKVVIDPAVEILNGVMNGASSGPGLAPVMYQWMMVLKFPGALSMVVSAYVTKVGIQSSKPFFQKAVT